jgi:hypothetical protein
MSECTDAHSAANKTPEAMRMFNDKRSKRVLLVAHCVLNQNARLDRCAHYPGAIREVAVLLIERGPVLIESAGLRLAMA